MNELLTNAANALEQTAIIVVNSWADDRTLREVFGWHNPALTRHDLANVAKHLAEPIRLLAQADIEVPVNLQATITDIPRRLQLLHSETIPYLFNGNGHQAAPAYLLTLAGIREALAPLLDWQHVSDTRAMPAVLARRLKTAQRDVESATADAKNLKEKIEFIQTGHRAAASVPSDIAQLNRARGEFEVANKDAIAQIARIGEKNSEAERLLASLMNSEAEASKLVAQCNEAYRVTTTVGLAASFDQRARSLGSSMWVWVFGLLVALVTGAVIGAQRVSLLTAALKGGDPQWGVIVIHAVLSMISVGAPLWFAWLATKQIGQRFRLAEDYGFKASVAKAYEGYRREAARIDSAFEARLFSSALSRLEEAPLRLVEETSHGSPWHELVSSEAFRSAMNNIPALREKFLDIAKKNSERDDASQRSSGKQSAPGGLDGA